MVVTKYTKIFIFFMASLTWIIYLDISNHFQRRKILGGAKNPPPQNLVARIISFFGVANDRLTGIYRHNALNASPFEIISADGAFFCFCRPIAA